MSGIFTKPFRAVVDWFTAPAIDIEGPCAHCPFRNAVLPDAGGSEPHDVSSCVLPSSDRAGAVMLSDEAMPLALDDDLLRKFEVWSNTPVVLAPRRPWYVRMLRPVRAWIPRTLEWDFRCWVSRKLFIVKG